ncbi:golgin subfamily A member 5-like [Mya arenaria]|uniref:golgin subfamily A member 5-like n=1 Tax=Mya arenaria TaxID=6604 RepID=UPI0022E4A541|nr:golgin subfamily A member 5-like [Mya arenaria]
MMQDDTLTPHNQDSSPSPIFYLSEDDDIQEESNRRRTETDSSRNPQAFFPPLVEHKSKSSYSTQGTGDTSKRSTSEDELRSLSTTPRYSHEDLGRIVSPPHSSDDEDTPTLDLTDRTTFIEPVNFSDTLSARHVILKSRSSNKAAYAQGSTFNDSFKTHTATTFTDAQGTNSSDKASTKSLKSSIKPVNQPAKPQLSLIRRKKEATNKSRQSSGGESLKSLNTLSSGHHKINVHRFRAAELMSMRMSAVDENLRDIMYDAETVTRDLSNEQDHRTLLENTLKQIEEDRKDLNLKIATLRVKLGVANSNFNVSKTECDQMRKKYQETEIQKARLEERIKTCTKELEKMKDPNNPESNVNLKKIVVNDRKEIRRLRTDLEGVRSERSEVQKLIQDRDEKINMLKIYIGEVKDQLSEVHTESETAGISVVGERKKRQEVEEKYNELLKEKTIFDEKMTAIQSQLEAAAMGTSGVHQQYEIYREKEDELQNKMRSAERKLRDVLTEIEQQKNRNMPKCTASSIKFHQYRMSRSVLVSETSPHVAVVTNPNSSVAASGYLGKTVVSTKPTTSLPGSKGGSKQTTPRVKGGSLPAKR